MKQGRVEEREVSPRRGREDKSMALAVRMSSSVVYRSLAGRVRHSFHHCAAELIPFLESRHPLSKRIPKLRVQFICQIILIRVIKVLHLTRRVSLAVFPNTDETVDDA